MATIESIVADLAAVAVEVDGAVVPVRYWDTRPDEITEDLLPFRVLQEWDDIGGEPIEFLTIGTGIVTVEWRINDLLFYKPLLSGSLLRAYERELMRYCEAWARAVTAAFRDIGDSEAELIGADKPQARVLPFAGQAAYYGVICTARIRHYLV